MKLETKLVRSRRLIEDWFPIAELSIESKREASAALKPAVNRLHVWWARRPLVASRAAVLGSLVGPTVNRDLFNECLGIRGDPVAASARLRLASDEGQWIENPFDYSRAFNFSPDADALKSLGLIESCCLDPTAGGGSIPFEAVRLGLKVIANDLNPVAALIVRATVELPALFGDRLVSRYKELAARFFREYRSRLLDLYPPCPLANSSDATYLWARTVVCPYCGGIVPLSPNWTLSSDGSGLKLVPQMTGGKRRIHFEIVEKKSEHGVATVRDGVGLCPFQDCGRTIDGEEIKRQAHGGQMGHQLYAIVYKELRSASGRKLKRPTRGFRTVRNEGDICALAEQRLAERRPEWQARNIIPDEDRYIGPADRSANYGVLKQIDMFNPRQLYGHCVSVEVFHDIVDKLSDGSILDELDRAALVYLTFVIDKMLNYNAIQVRWHSGRELIAGVFDRHDFSFKWSYAEMNPIFPGLGMEWAIEQTGKALKELVNLVGSGTSVSGRTLFSEDRPSPSICIFCGSGESLPLPNSSIDCVVMDPPYYDNVMYAELSDFFYVWLKRTAGLLYPELFTSYLTDKDREAVANSAKFAGEQGGAKYLAGRDYQERMAAIFVPPQLEMEGNAVSLVERTNGETTQALQFRREGFDPKATPA